MLLGRNLVQVRTVLGKTPKRPLGLALAEHGCTIYSLCQPTSCRPAKVLHEGSQLAPVESGGVLRAVHLGVGSVHERRAQFHNQVHGPAALHTAGTHNPYVTNHETQGAVNEFSVTRSACACARVSSPVRAAPPASAPACLRVHYCNRPGCGRSPPTQPPPWPFGCPRLRGVMGREEGESAGPGRRGRGSVATRTHPCRVAFPSAE